ncbi:MAG: hypothetical protein WC378_11220, partial [Opitutaceae bacterium]
MNALCSLAWRVLDCIASGIPLCAGQFPSSEEAPIVAATGFIQTAALDSSRPFFIPTHPRVTTTIRFPSAIGAPDGRGFTEDELKQPGEYLVSWSPGDPHFTLTPLRNAGPLNLNVPYQGSTYVLYFYPVEQQFQAVASLNLAPPSADPGRESAGGATAPIVRSTAPAAAPFKTASPARMLGIIDRLKLVGSLAPGARLAELVSQLDAEVALSPPQSSDISNNAPPAVLPAGVSAWLPRSSTDCGIFEIRLLRTLRDRRLNVIGFALLIRNRSTQAIALDPSSFAARAGSLTLSQFVSDAPAILTAGEEREAFFAVKCPAGAPLLASNEWRVSVDLIS